MSSDAEQPAEDFSKTDEQWKQKLTAEQFRVTRKKGTERAFTGKYWDCKSDGMYHCVCCGVSLFSSDAVFLKNTLVLNQHPIVFLTFNGQLLVADLE